MTPDDLKAAVESEVARFDRRGLLWESMTVPGASVEAGAGGYRCDIEGARVTVATWRDMDALSGGVQMRYDGALLSRALRGIIKLLPEQAERLVRRAKETRETTVEPKNVSVIHIVPTTGPEETADEARLSGKLALLKIDGGTAGQFRLEIAVCPAGHAPSEEPFDLVQVRVWRLTKDPASDLSPEAGEPPLGEDDEDEEGDEAEEGEPGEPIEAEMDDDEGLLGGGDEDDEDAEDDEGPPDDEDDEPPGDPQIVLWCWEPVAGHLKAHPKIKNRTWCPLGCGAPLFDVATHPEGTPCPGCAHLAAEGQDRPDPLAGVRVTN